jgi:TM2 domain-containing membrane protein YozV
VRRVVAASIVALVCAAPGLARADAKDDLEKAHNAYVTRRYDDAEARLRTLLDPAGNGLKDADLIADARMYLAATLLAEGKNEAAASTLEDLLIARPDYQADPLRVALEAIDALTDAKARLRDKLAAMQAEKVRRAQEEKAKLEAERQKQVLRLAMLEKLATSEVVVERHSRWLSLVPFGVGQFQNGQTAEGWLFLTAEGLFAAGTVVAAGYAYAYEEQAWKYHEQGNSAAQSAYTSAAHWAAITDDVLAGGFVLAAAAGIIHAEATYVPERVQVRKREIPPLSLTPVVGPTGIGVVGRF